MAEEKHYPDDLPMWGEKKTSVPEVRALLDALGTPDCASRVIHVAEINGKGSICTYLTGALRRAGYRVGTFASPHLVDVRERILVNGKMIPSEVFRAAAETMRCQGEAEVRAGQNLPAYFEYFYYTAILLSREVGCEAITLETGFGGRLDATNSCAPRPTALTSISLDHMQYFGGTVEKIAAEKADVTKKKVPVVYLDAMLSVAGITAAKAQEMQAPAYPVTPDRTDMRPVFPPAPHQRENTAFVVKTFQVLSGGGTGNTR